MFKMFAYLSKHTEHCEFCLVCVCVERIAENDEQNKKYVIETE